MDSVSFPGDIGTSASGEVELTGFCTMRERCSFWDARPAWASSSNQGLSQSVGTGELRLVRPI